MNELAPLALYDQARQALAAAVRVDEVRRVIDVAEQIRLYGKQAEDRGLMADAMELQVRAERRLGELLVQAKEAGQLSRGGRPRHAPETDSGGAAVSGPIVLRDAGISLKLSARAQKLAGVPEADFDTVVEAAREKIAAGRAVVVNPVKDVSSQDKRVRRMVREAQLALRQRALPDKRYGVIYADPEWPFATWSEAGRDRSADNHYPTSLVPVIASRDVAAIAAPDCALFLWITRPMLPAGLLVLEAWGFGYVTCWDWDKLVEGTGYWCRDRSEILLLGTRGQVPCPAPGTQWPSLVAERKREHSRKPDWAYEMIEAYFPRLPKIELNARARRAGWDAWGFEAPPPDPAGTEGGNVPGGDISAHEGHEGYARMAGEARPARTLAQAFEEAGQ